MKIALTGAHRVGKTTLAENIHEVFPDYELTIEPYHELAESGYLFPEEPEIDDYIEQFNFSINQLKSAGKNTIFDRCPLDFFAYIIALEPSLINKYYQKTIDSIIELDLAIYVPIEDPDLIYGNVSELPELRNEVNEIIQDYIKDLEINTIVVKGDVNSRTGQVITAIQKLTNKL